MTKPKDVAVFVGSLRKDSFCLKIAKALGTLAPKELKLDIIEIGHLPFYNQDLDTATPPSSWIAFRQRVHKADAALFITPEYNRSTPPALKNALDIASRPYGESVWVGKPAAIISSSPGAIGGFGANHHLRQSLVFLDMPTMQQPEAYIGQADKLFDANDNFTSAGNRDFLINYMKAYAKWIEHFLPR